MRLASDCTNNRQLRWASIVALLATAGIPAATWLVHTLDPSPLAAAADRGASSPGASARRSALELPITAPARIQPRDGVITIAAPASDGGPAVVATLPVRPGEWVRQGQVLATLRGQAELEARLISAHRTAQIARTRLSALLSGGKADDLDALRCGRSPRPSRTCQLRRRPRRRSSRRPRMSLESVVTGQRHHVLQREWCERYRYTDKPDRENDGLATRRRYLTHLQRTIGRQP